MCANISKYNYRALAQSVVYYCQLLLVFPFKYCGLYLLRNEQCLGSALALYLHDSVTLCVRFSREIVILLKIKRKYIVMYFSIYSLLKLFLFFTRYYWKYLLAFYESDGKLRIYSVTQLTFFLFNKGKFDIQVKKTDFSLMLII